MKNIFLIIFLLVLSLYLKAQQTDCKDIDEKESIAYKKGTGKPFTGKCISWIDVSHKSFESTYKDGKLNGKEITWNRKGIIISESNYKEGKYDGLVLHFYDDGKIKSREFYKGDYKNGVSTYYYSNGNKESEGSYINCSEEGSWTYWNEDDGSLKKTVIYKNGEVIDEK